MNRLLKQVGFSTIETIIAVALMGVVITGGIKLAENSQKQTINTSQNLEIDGFMKTLKQILRNSEGCIDLIGTTSIATLTVEKLKSSVNFDLGSNVTIKSVKIESPTVTAGGTVNILPIPILITFNKVLNGNNRLILKKAFAHAQFNSSGTFKSCVDFELESIKSAYKVACETVGGEFNDGAADTYDCNFSNMTGQEPFIVASLGHICDKVFHGVYTNGVCNRIGLNGGTVTASNIDNSGFVIGGNKRLKFAESCAGTNQFVRGVDIAGGASCINVIYCTPGHNCYGDTNYVE
jgi:hypothetical protein